MHICRSRFFARMGSSQPCGRSEELHDNCLFRHKSFHNEKSRITNSSQRWLRSPLRFWRCISQVNCIRGVFMLSEDDSGFHHSHITNNMSQHLLVYFVQIYFQSWCFSPRKKLHCRWYISGSQFIFRTSAHDFNASFRSDFGFLVVK